MKKEGFLSKLFKGYKYFVGKLISRVKGIDNEKTMLLLHGSMGLSTESNEILDHMKRVIFYGIDVDKVNIKEELGDLMFYTQIIMTELDLDIEEVIETNKAKLTARYGDKFSSDRAVNRDLEKERAILEKDNV